MMYAFTIYQVWNVLSLIFCFILTSRQWIHCSGTSSSLLYWSDGFPGHCRHLRKQLNHCFKAGKVIYALFLWKSNQLEARFLKSFSLYADFVQRISVSWSEGGVSGLKVLVFLNMALLEPGRDLTKSKIEWEQNHMTCLGAVKATWINRSNTC